MSMSDVGYRRHWDRCRCPPMTFRLLQLSAEYCGVPLLRQLKLPVNDLIPFCSRADTLLCQLKLSVNDQIPIVLELTCQRTDHWSQDSYTNRRLLRSYYPFQRKEAPCWKCTGTDRIVRCQQTSPPPVDSFILPFVVSIPLSHHSCITYSFSGHLISK
jgi:hypothetical protein